MAAYSRLLSELRERIAGNSETATWASLYVDLFVLQARVDVHRCAASANRESLRACLREGRPLLAAEDLQLDRATFCRLCHDICTIVTKHHPELAAQMDTVRAWVDQDVASEIEWASLLAENHSRRSEERPLEASLLALVYNRALHPFLCRYAQLLMPFVDQVAWYRPICPICGGEPDLSALSTTSGERRLLCSRCDAEWPYFRTGCPFCGEDDPAEQKYTVSDDGVYRLYLCDRCKRYLKAIDLRQVGGERLLPVERILSAPLDIAAQQAGYTGPRMG